MSIAKTTMTPRISLFAALLIIAQTLVLPGAAAPTEAGDVVYRRYVRRRPSRYPSDRWEEDVVEVFNVQRRPPPFLLTDDEIDRIIRCDFDPSLAECELLSRPLVPPTVDAAPSSSTTPRPTPASGFAASTASSWPWSTATEARARTTSTTSTTTRSPPTTTTTTTTTARSPAASSGATTRSPTTSTTTTTTTTKRTTSWTSGWFWNTTPATTTTTEEDLPFLPDIPQSKEEPEEDPKRDSEVIPKEAGAEELEQDEDENEEYEEYGENAEGGEDKENAEGQDEDENEYENGIDWE